MASKSGKFKQQNVEELFISAADAPAEEPKKETVQNNVEIPRGYKLVKENKSERMQLLVRPDTKKTIKQEAIRQHISMNDLVNQIFEDYIERSGL